MKKGIVFDLDGTLWDACSVITDSWNEYLNKVRTDLASYHLSVKEEDVRRLCGQTMDVFGEVLFPQIPEKAVRGKLMDELCAYEVEYMKNVGGEVYPGVVETLKKLSEHYALYIVSNCQVGYIEDFLNWSGTKELFEDTEDYGTTLKTKDQNIRLLAERNRLDRAVYVGDTIMDYQSCTKAGLPFVHCRYGFGQVPDVPYVEKFSDLPQVIEKMFS